MNFSCLGLFIILTSTLAPFNVNHSTVWTILQVLLHAKTLVVRVCSRIFEHLLRRDESVAFNSCNQGQPCYKVH